MIDINGLKVTLIGGGGFIGHNLALHLNKLGAEVDIIDSLQVNNLYAFGRAQKEIVNRELYIKIINQRLDMLRMADIPLHLQDARDYHALNVILADIKPDVIIHLAAVSHANKANKDPYSTFDHSLRTLENSLDIARGLAKHFIYFFYHMHDERFTMKRCQYFAWKSFRRHSSLDKGFNYHLKLSIFLFYHGYRSPGENHHDYPLTLPSPPRGRGVMRLQYNFYATSATE